MCPELDGPGRPGSEASLAALYDAVPATEELDLREEWERHNARGVSELLSPDEDTSPSDDEASEPLTERQVFGMVEHLLGAELVTDDESDPGEQRGD